MGDSSSISSKDGGITTPTPLSSNHFPGRIRRTNKVFKPFTPPRFILGTGNSNIQEFFLGLSTPKPNFCLANGSSVSSRQHLFRSGTLGTGRIREPVFHFDTNNTLRDRLSVDSPPLYRKDTFLIRSGKRLQSRKLGELANNPIGLSEVCCPPEENEILSTSQKSIQNAICLNLLSTCILPEKYRFVFSFSHFNRMQSESFETIYNSNQNCVINAPTGSGKTVLFELAILRLFNLSNMNNKTLYMVPNKALCSEKYCDWVGKFSILGVTVGVLTSETTIEEIENVKRSNIIVSTPEKLDLLTRKLSNYDTILKDVKLILIDEIHTLKDSRGSTLEVGTTRINKICSQVRIVGASASAPNLHDISAWLRKKGDLNPAVTLSFDDTYRSVQLDKIVLGYASQRGKDFHFDQFLHSKLVGVIKHYGNNKPTLIFCPTRNSCLKTAKYLDDNFDHTFCTQNPLINFDEEELQIYAAHGIAFHHAGLSPDDRKKVELLFIEGKLNILCSTSTLSLGVNLPTFLVIIKGTKRWYNGSFHEYKETDILQMIGRAGRPQFETQGKAVIMTTSDQKVKYQRVLKGILKDGSERIESCLHLNLAEHLVAEISLGAIGSIDDTLQWLKSTFFFIRFTSNPSYYKEITSSHTLDPDKKLHHFCQKYLDNLINERIVSSQPSGGFRCTEYGDVMTKYYILYPTMRNIIRSKVGNTLFDILTIFSRSSEFSELSIKYNEKRLYKAINLSPYIKFPLNSSEFQDSDKVILLLQYELCRLEFPKIPDSMKLYYSFEGEKCYVFKQASRIIHCMADVFRYKKDYISLLNTLKFLRCITGRCWENSMTGLRQLSGINSGCISIKEAKCLSQMQLQSCRCGESGAGKTITPPEFRINATLASNRIRTDLETLEVKLTISISVDNIEKGAWKTKDRFISAIVGISTGELVDFRRFAIAELTEGEIKSYRLTASVTDRQQKIHCHILSENMFNIDVQYSLNLDIIEPWKFENLMDQKSKNESDYNSSSTKEFDNVLALYVRSDSESVLESDDLIFDPVKSIRSVTEILKEKCTSKDSQSKTICKIRPDGNYECNHLCKNKTKCRHFCCRDGIPSLERQKTTNNHVDLKSNDHISQSAAICSSVDRFQTSNLAGNKKEQGFQHGSHLPSFKRKKIKLGQRVGIFNINNGRLFDN